MNPYSYLMLNNKQQDYPDERARLDSGSNSKLAAQLLAEQFSALLTVHLSLPTSSRATSERRFPVATPPGAGLSRGAPLTPRRSSSLARASYSECSGGGWVDTDPRPPWEPGCPASRLPSAPSVNVVREALSGAVADRSLITCRVGKQKTCYQGAG